MPEHSDQTLWDETSEAIEMGDYEPTDWEVDFLDDIEDKLDRLTESQHQKLEEIHQNACELVVSRYHANWEKCPHCGITYGEFRTGMSYADVFAMLWSLNEDSSTWMYKRRRTVLGKWHQIKMSWWKHHIEQGCMEMGLPAEEYKDPPAFDLDEAFEVDSQLGADLSDVPF
jgi:hypothetical protein